MLFSQLLKELSVGETKHTAMITKYNEGNPAEKAEAISQIMIYVNEFLRDVHMKYDLLLGEYTYRNLSTNQFRIPDKAFVKLIKIIDAYGNELSTPTYVGQLSWDYRLVGVGTVAFNPKSDAAAFGCIVYRKTCTPIRTEQDEIDLYESMLNLLKAYMSYRLSTPQGANTSTEQNLYYARYKSQEDAVERELGIRNEEFLNKPKGYYGAP